MVECSGKGPGPARLQDSEQLPLPRGVSERVTHGDPPSARPASPQRRLGGQGGRGEGPAGKGPPRRKGRRSRRKVKGETCAGPLGLSRGDRQGAGGIAAKAPGPVMPAEVPRGFRCTGLRPCSPPGRPGAPRPAAPTAGGGSGSLPSPPALQAGPGGWGQGRVAVSSRTRAGAERTAGPSWAADRQ